VDQNKKELEQKIAAASSPQELQRILNDAGEKIGPEDAAKLFEKLQNRGTAGSFPRMSWRPSAAVCVTGSRKAAQRR